MEQVFTTADKLSEVIRNMQKCLQCIICLHTITNPIKTICGHRFCRLCIQKVLKTENTVCPLCNNVLQRRSIFTDEQMVVYIDRFEKLVNGIQLDSGIDILSTLTKPCNVRDSCSSDDSEYHKFDDEDVIKPSCSYAKSNAQWKRLNSRSNLSQRSQRKPRGRRGRRKAEPQLTNTVTRYISTCGLSGIEPLGPDEPNENSSDKSVNKVHGWLDALPDNAMLDDPINMPNVEPVEVNLDDTLPISVSQNVTNMETENVDKMNEIIVESVILNNIPRSMTKQFPESSSRKENNSIGKKNRRDSSDTKIVQNYSSRMDCKTENAKPGPSAGSKSNEDGKEKSEDKFNDVHRTSPCDMLSTMQQNWSVVAKFGKEMRTKRKKLKTLNVSIENKGKPRPLDEPGAKLDEDEVRSIVMDDTRKKRRKGSSKSKMAQYITKTVAQEGFVEARKSTGKIKVRERKASLNKERDKSVSGKDQQNDEPFITLSDDEPENVQYLNDQINDIIGVTCSDRGAGTKKDVANNREEMIDWESLAEESRNKKDDGPTTPKSGIDESHSPLKTSSAIRGRLSLKRPTTDVKSNDAVDSKIVSLQQVRRDLSRQIDQDEGNDEISEKNVKRVSKTEKRKSFARNKQDSRRDSNSTVVSEFASSSMEKKMHNMSLVAFKKLGKTYKRRKKQVSFLYLGTTRRNAMLDSSCAQLTNNLQKPCNLVDILDSQVSQDDCTSENGFGNRVRITVNSSPSTYHQEIENVPKEIEFITKVNDVSGAEDPTEDIALEDRFDEQIRRHPGKETVSVKETIHVANNPQDPYTLLVSVNEESIPPGVRRLNTSNNACKDDVKMLTPTKDSQLQFLSLESPPMDTLPTQKLFEEPELATEGPFKRKSFVQPDTEVLQEFPDCTSSKKRRRSNTQKTFSRKISTDKKEDDRASNHSFSSQVTCISKNAVGKKKNLMETRQLSNHNSKDIETMSLSSDTGIVDNAGRDKRKVYKRIVPLVASDTDSNEVVCVNNLPNDHPAVSSAAKRKRYMSFDSESESGLEEILSNWYAEAKLGDQCKKKGKLEQACDSSNSMNASRAARDDALSKACSSGRGESTNKLSTQQRRNPLELAGKSGIEESSFTRARLRKNIDGTGGQVVDEDSPDFGATIDKMKDIRNKMVVPVEEQGITKEESLMQDNMDDIFASVNTDVLADEYTVGKAEKCKGKSVECQKLSDYERNSKQKRLNVQNVYSSSEELSRVRSNSSNKENKNSGADVLRVSNEDDNTLVSTTVNVSSKSAKSNKFQDKIKAVRTSRESTRIQTNKSSRNPVIASDYNKFSTNDSYVKDTYDMDSLMNITQRDMLLKQFEQDLFGKPKSNSPPEKQKTPQKSRRSKECSKENKKDVEHSGEEDDVVENTPDTKTKNMQAITSPPGSSIASSISKITVRPFLAKSTPSTIGKSSVSISVPGCKRNMQPLYQSTPKSQKFTTPGNIFANRKFLPVANESSSKQTKRNVVRESIDQGVQNVQNVGRQRLCFVCSGLLQTEITEVKRLAEMFNARYVMQFDRDVSHVIVKADKENNGANKTLKYLQGIAHRKWIVTYDWVVNSLKQCRLVNEEPYEAVDSRTLEAGPRKSRLSERRLFEGFMFLCIGPYSDVSVGQYRELISAAGATVVDSLDALAAEKNMLKIIVIQTDIYEYEIIAEWFKKAQAVAIIHDWVVECISQFQLISFFPYMQELTRHDVLSLGYPEYLVEEDNDVESESTCDFTT